MEGDPYIHMASIIRGGSSNSGAGLRLRLGKVKATAPLVLEAGGIEISGAELRLCAQLGPQLSMIVPTNPLQSAFQATITPQFSAGDELLLLTEDDQVFYILCKVVST